MKKTFVANPGLGWIHKGDTTPQGCTFWQGEMTLHPIAKEKPKRVALQGVAIQAPYDASKADLKAHAAAGGDRYEFKLVEIASKAGEWKHLGAFTLSPFGERKTQIVDTPVGKLAFWLQAPRNKSDWMIRTRIITDSNGVVHAARPM